MALFDRAVKYDFIFVFYSKYASVYYRFRDIAAHWSKYVLSFTLWTVTTTNYTKRNVTNNASALGRSKLRSYFRRLWNKLHQIQYACAEEMAVYNAVFCWTISCFIPEIFTTKFGSCPKFAQISKFFGQPNFLGEGQPNF